MVKRLIYSYIMKLNIVVPYRNRKEHLNIFVPHMINYLKDYDYEIWIIEQGNEKSFNRGFLINAGYLLSKKENSYFCAHDIDVITNEIDYSYPGKVFRHPYGGALNHNLGLLFITDNECFEKCNGFPNNYWGWGMEDITLIKRANRLNIKIDESNFLYQGYCNTYELGHSKIHNENELNRNSEYDNNDYLSWENNGLSNCSFRILKEMKIHENVNHIIIDF